MAITPVRIKDIDYLKIHLQWGLKNHSKYLPMPAGTKAQERTWAKAREVEADMAHKQALYRAGKALQISTYLRDDGRVIGITRTRSSKGSDVFRASVWDNVKRTQSRTSVSVSDELGVQDAYLLVLERWIDFRHLEHEGTIHQALKAGYIAYLFPEEKEAMEGGDMDELPTQAPSIVDEFESALQAQVNDFLSKRTAGGRSRR